MDNESKNTTAKEAVLDQIKFYMRMSEERIATLSEEMNKDYRQFFEDCAEEMYEEKTLSILYGQLFVAVNEHDGENLGKYLFDMAQSKINSVARGNLTRNSSNQMANLAHVFRLQAEQTIILELRDLAYLATTIE